MRKQVLLLSLGTVCCARLEPSDTDDVARLALLDLSTAVQLVNDDESCGFESPAAIATQMISGEPGQEGTVVRAIDGCVVDLDREPSRYPFFVCDEHAGTARGRVRFTGTRTMHGQITGDDTNPVIPTRSDALAITIEEVAFENFEIARRDKAGSLAILKGSASGHVKIGLAASAADGLCRIPTPNARLEDISFNEVSARFTNLLKTRDFTIARSSLDAANGDANLLRGSLTIGDMPLGVDTAFDPEFDRDVFQRSFACERGEARTPVTYACGDINAFIAENTARISFLAFVDLIGLLEKDDKCGFNSPAVKNAAVAEGRLGETGTLTTRVTDCTIALPAAVNLDADCLGNSDVVRGRATISATKIMRGTLTDDPDSRVLPRTDSPLSYEITASRLEDFEATRAARSALIHEGSLRGIMRPRVAQGTTRGFCSVGTPIAELESINLENARVRLTTELGIVTGTTEESNLWGVNGAWRGNENALGGSIVVNDGTHILPGDAETSGMFEPIYDPATFSQSWQCKNELARPISFSCSVELPVPETISRMSVGLLGALTRFIENDSACGFASEAVKQSAQFSGATGDNGTTTFTVTNCRITDPIVTTDCNGKTVTISGELLFRAAKRMTGYNTGWLARQIVPTTRDGTIFDVTVELAGVSYNENDPQAAEPNIGMFIERASIAGVVSPRLALDPATGACSEPTPITTFTNVGFKTETEVKLLFPGLDYTATVGGMSISAQSGSKDGRTNTLSGGLSVAGQEYRFPADGSTPLDPDFDPARFNQSYMCNKTLVLTDSDQQCDFKEVLALQTARYLPMVVQSVGALVNADGNCGLDIADEQLEPYVHTPVGGTGSASWRAPHGLLDPPCRYRSLAGAVASRDCLQRSLVFAGEVDVRANLLVRGRVREFRDNVYVNPTCPDAVTDYSLDIRRVANLRVAQIDPPSTVVQSLMLESGSINILFHPIMGESSAEDPDLTYLVRTPINRFSSIEINSPTQMSLTIGEMRFNALLGGALVSGFSGTFNDESNHIQGTVTLDGRTLNVSDTLDPAYDQADFDARYRCTNELVSLVPTTMTCP